MLYIRRRGATVFNAFAFPKSDMLFFSAIVLSIFLVLQWPCLLFVSLSLFIKLVPFFLELFGHPFVWLYIGSDYYSSFFLFCVCRCPFSIPTYTTFFFF